MKDAKGTALATEARIRAIAVAAGLMTEEQAEQWIIVKPGVFGKGHFKGVHLPSACTDCGGKTNEGWLPLEVGISREMPERARNQLFFLMNTDNSGTDN